MRRRRIIGPSFPYLVNPVTVGSGLDPATNAWVAAVGTVSSTQKTNVNNLILGLKLDGLFTLTDGLWLWAGESSVTQAATDIVNLHVGTVGPTMSLTAAGYISSAGGGPDTWFDSGIDPHIGTWNFTQNSCGLGAYFITGETTEDSTLVGVGAGAGTRIDERSSGTMRFIINNSSGVDDLLAAVRTGMIVGSRTAVSTGAGYRNGASLGALTTTADQLPTTTFSFFARHDGGTTYSTSMTGKLAAGWIGGGLNATQVANLSSRINAYMTAWGVNTY